MLEVQQGGFEKKKLYLERFASGKWRERDVRWRRSLEARGRRRNVMDAHLVTLFLSSLKVNDELDSETSFCCSLDDKILMKLLILLMFGTLLEFFYSFLSVDDDMYFETCCLLLNLFLSLLLMMIYL